MRHVSLLILVMFFYVFPNELHAFDDPKINTAIKGGQNFLVANLGASTDARKSLAAYALVKTGWDKHDPRIQAAVDAALKLATEHYASGMDRFGHEFAYSVPCHIFLLEAVDSKEYLPVIESMAGYLVEHQQENGAWFYTHVPMENASDTSQTQFALLGLWAASRAGVEIPGNCWQKACAWLLETQKADGGYAYQPWDNVSPHTREVSLSTTLAGLSSLLLIRNMSRNDGQFGAGSGKTKKKKFGVLERLPETQEPVQKSPTFEVNVSAIDKSVSKSLGYTNEHFKDQVRFQHYALYGMERVAAFLDSNKIGDYDWYAYASEFLLRSQHPNGSWGDDVPNTCFSILCLSRATAATLGKPPGPKVGGGLMQGARGLPDNLAKLQLKDGQALERPSKGEVDDLLAELEKSPDVTVADVQKSILESVNLDDREQLVGQLDRLKRLAVDPRAEVRRTALWAIGRSGEIQMAPLLIAGLSDVDVDVIQEASYGLTVLSRKPTGIIDGNGISIPVEPLAGLPEDATEEQRAQHLGKWHAVAVPAWKKWYISVRPYAERDDRLQIQKKR